MRWSAYLQSTGMEQNQKLHDNAALHQMKKAKKHAVVGQDTQCLINGRQMISKVALVTANL